MRQTAKWIWYPGDFEVLLFNKCMARRYQRDALITPFWKLDSVCCNVKFERAFTLSARDTIQISAEGQFNVFIPEAGGYIHNFNGTLELAAGSYHLSVLVYNQSGLPCLYVCGRELVSDERFTATCQDFEVVNAGCSDYINTGTPNTFRLPVERKYCVQQHKKNGGVLYDFGEETVAYLRFHRARIGQRICCWYGESQEEALDTAFCEQLDVLKPRAATVETEVAKAFRYVFVTGGEGAELTALAESTGHTDRSSFYAEDALIQRIWNVSVRTLSLNAREFFLDGIKRDRWSWAGDAYQSYFMNYYTLFDTEIVKRTTVALKGKAPHKTHINHIMDYTLYWVLGLYDQYRYTGDLSFLRAMLPDAEEYLAFCRNRTDENGFLCRRENDWVFIDWAEMDNRGVTSFEQILYAAALQRMAKMEAAVCKDGSVYLRQAEALLARTRELFWDSNGGYYLHSLRGGASDGRVTRYANMFAVLFGLCSREEETAIVENVLLNSAVQKITTPYMRFYELEVLCKIGRYSYVMEEIKFYWGGMLREGATSFWEAFDPAQGGAEKYAMYGRRYGKSLCHAWGASPVYLIAKCFYGIEPREDGYKSFTATPQIALLAGTALTVPVMSGSLTVEVGHGQVIVRSDIPGEVWLPGEFAEDGEGLRNGLVKKEVAANATTVFKVLTASCGGGETACRTALGCSIPK